MYLTIKQKVHLLLDPADGHSKWDRVVNTVIVCLILGNTVAVILETVESIYQFHKELFRIFETFSVIVFSVEYLLRVWSCTAIKKYEGSVTGRLKYILSIGAIIDLLAIIPFYLPLLTIYDLRFVRILRLLRFFRFFKLSRYLNASKVIGNVFKSKKEELVLSFIITLFLIVVASSVMYYAEHDAQPNKFSSIPETMWWSVATLTTVGYGDEYPITSWGKFLTACISILGIGMFALPAGILASGFSDEFKKMKRDKNLCPHCGNEL
jgi:voltage-gated potassium channel